MIDCSTIIRNVQTEVFNLNFSTLEGTTLNHPTYTKTSVHDNGVATIHEF